MKIEVNITKTKLFIMIVSVLLFAGAIMVYAGTPTASKSNPGHDISELQKCPSGSVLKSDSIGNWECGVDISGSGTTTTVLNTDYCNSVEYTSLPNSDVNQPFSLIKDGRNMCADTGGCTLSVWSEVSNLGYYWVKFKQISGGASDGAWSAGGQGINYKTGKNGDGVSNDLYTVSGGGTEFTFKDDLSGTEISKDQIVVYMRNQASASSAKYIVSVCDY